MWRRNLPGSLQFSLQLSGTGSSANTPGGAPPAPPGPPAPPPNPNPTPTPPAPPPIKSLATPIVTRVLEADSTDGKRRLDRFTSKLSEIVNSLVVQGSLYQSAVGVWQIASSAVALTAGAIVYALGFTPVPNTRQVLAGGGLHGGGPLTADVTLGMNPVAIPGSATLSSVTINEVGQVTALVTGDPMYGIGAPDAGIGTAGVSVYFDVTDTGNIQFYFKT